MIMFLMGIYLSTPKTEKASEDGENDKLRFGLSSMQGWRASMEDAHAAHPYLDESTSYFGVYDGHGGKAVSKFCAKYLHQQVLKSEAYLAGDLGTSLQKSFLRMDEMMRGQRGWRELAVLGDKIEKLSGMLEGFIWSPRSSEANDRVNDWAFEEAHNLSKDHKPELEAEKDRILKAGGFIQVGRVNGSLNLARAIGDMEFKQNKYLPVEKQIVTADPDITSVELCDDDEFLVIACDGIWDCMSSQQLVDFIHQQLKTENKLSAVCEKVFDRCLAPTAGGEGCDNMTMILIQFKKPSSSPDASSVTNQPQSSAQPSEADRSSETIESK
ncbi:putative protein phosphatase 2C 60 isoform C [Glycine soja]|uniref:protein-serine/threonine phosphatase n=1 Tax=Glycine soja TaxID=3848 RepID=A0A445JRC9_GLYSO|nr:putative protein phosphatase 2C 60 isoform C [Glycine soja]